MASIRKDIIGNGRGALGRVDYIVIHETANPGATAQNHRDYWSRDDTYAVHAVCDWTEIIQTVPYDRLCWHVGNANGFTIGIEVCHATNAADFEKAWANALAWARAMMERFGLDASRVVSHDYCRRKWGGTDHTDPIGYFAEFGKTWDDFIEELGGTAAASSPGSAAAGGSDGFRGGVYRCTVNGLRIRRSPSLSGKVVPNACYNKGETVTLDSWYTVADGYVWGRYTSYSGETRYIAVGKATGKPEADDYLVKV